MANIREGTDQTRQVADSQDKDSWVSDKGTTNPDMESGPEKGAKETTKGNK